MSANVTTFEVKVAVKYPNQEYNCHRAMWVFDEAVKMFHKEARTAKQAMDKCRKYGLPISARKVDVSAMFGNFENLQLDGIYKSGNKVYQPNYKPDNKVYKSDNQVYHAVEMDARATEKRNRRINDRQKDKQGLDS